MNNNMQAIIDAFALIGIKVPEGTKFSDLIKIMKSNKKLLAAHDAVLDASAAGPEDDDEGEGEGSGEGEGEGEGSGEGEGEGEGEGSGEGEGEGSGEGEGAGKPAPKVPAKKITPKPEEKNDDKPVKNKFVIQR